MARAYSGDNFYSLQGLVPGSSQKSSNQKVCVKHRVALCVPLTSRLVMMCCLKKNLNAYKPSSWSKGLGENSGCRDKSFTRY